MENKHEKTKEKVLRAIQEIVDKIYEKQIEKELEEDIIKQQKSMREFCFHSSNANHDFIEEIKCLATIRKFRTGMQYKDFPMFIKSKTAKLYVDYKQEEYFDFEFGKELTIKILTNGKIEDEDQQKIISLMIEKYDDKIDEYFDEAAEELKQEWGNDMFPPIAIF
jgi:uncharacterized damage-inducible protein DinB